MTKTIYIASPLGFSEAGRDFLYRTLIPRIEQAGFQCIDPWKLTPVDLLKSAQDLPYGQEKRKKWRQVNQVIGKNNALAIRECDAIFAVLDGVDVDSGTASEIGFAAALNKPALGYRGDFRLSADNEGSTVNLQVEYFIRSSGGRIINSLDDLEEALKMLF